MRQQKKVVGNKGKVFPSKEPLSKTEVIPFTYLYRLSKEDADKYLSKHKNGIKVNGALINGIPFIHLLASRGREDILELFKKHGIDVDWRVRDKKKRNIALFSARHDLRDTLSFLLNNDIDVDWNEEDYRKRIALHYILKNDDVETLKKLKEKGIPLNFLKEDERGSTPIHKAIQGVATQVLNYMVENNELTLDMLTKKDREGKTPMDFLNSHLPESIDKIKYIVSKFIISQPIHEKDLNRFIEKYGLEKYILKLEGVA